MTYSSNSGLWVIIRLHFLLESYLFNGNTTRQHNTSDFALIIGLPVELKTVRVQQQVGTKKNGGMKGQPNLLHIFNYNNYIVRRNQINTGVTDGYVLILEEVLQL